MSSTQGLRGSTHSRGLRQGRSRGPAFGRSNTIGSTGSKSASPAPPLVRSSTGPVRSGHYNNARSKSPLAQRGHYQPSSPTAPPLARSATSAGNYQPSSPTARAARAAPPLQRSNTGDARSPSGGTAQRRLTRRGLRKNNTSDGTDQLLGMRDRKQRGLRNSTHQRGLSGSVHMPRVSNASTVNAGASNYLSQLHNASEPNFLVGVDAENQGSTSNLNFNQDDSDKSPILGDLNVLDVGGRPELDRQISGISCLSFEAEEEEEDMFIPRRKSERRTFEDMAGEAQSVASGEKQLNQSEDQYEMEVSPGYFLPFRGSTETYQQIQKGNSLETCCLECGRELVSVADCQCVVCSECQMVNPVFEYPPHVDASRVHGIGMGFQKAWVLQKQQQEQQRQSRVIRA